MFVDRNLLLSVDIIQILSEATGLLPRDIRGLIYSADVSYKTYTIPKRTGGERIISQPTREIKLLQRILVDKILSKLPIHPSATAYRRGQSLVANVEPHKGVGRPILKMDFKDFFPSIRDTHWLTYCAKNNLFSQENRFLIAKLVFKHEPHLRGNRLAIGAPSSPIMSNIMMYEFDSLLYEIAKEESVVYTRYADDLTFSAERTGFMVDIQKKVKYVLRKIDYPRLQIKNEKTVYATSKYKRSITGVILTNDGKISLGRNKKREISAAVHHSKLSKLSDLENKKLAGYLAYANTIEPDFLNRLRKKYGEDTLRSIFRWGSPNIK